MQRLVAGVMGVLLLMGAVAHADEATEREIMQLIMDDNAYARKNLKERADTTARDGSLEFWSSGGLMKMVSADAEPQEFEAINIDVNHIHVVTLVPGQAAVAQYYSDGSMHPKNSAAVSDYRTRVTQVFVKEGGKWKVRAAHWSPIAGGAGTSQTGTEQ